MGGPEKNDDKEGAENPKDPVVELDGKKVLDPPVGIQIEFLKALKANSGEMDLSEYRKKFEKNFVGAMSYFFDELITKRIIKITVKDLNRKVIVLNPKVKMLNF